MKTKLSLLLLLIFTIMTVNAQNVISGTDCNSATLEKIMTKAGFEVIVAEPDYVHIIQDTSLQIKPYIDINKENQWLVINMANALKDGVTPAQAKELVLEINSETNFIKATYNEENKTVEFRYYFITKGGFTEEGLLSVMDVFKLTYIYAITIVDKKELFK
jgi:hypothetical protein